MIRSLVIAWKIINATDRYPEWLCWILIPLLCLPINFALVEIFKGFL